MSNYLQDIRRLITDLDCEREVIGNILAEPSKSGDWPESEWWQMRGRHRALVNAVARMRNTVAKLEREPNTGTRIVTLRDASRGVRHGV